MQKEFVNIADHELRTPIQPIIGLTEVIRSKIKDVIIRSARRLQLLTEDILDVDPISGFHQWYSSHFI
jgi:two-component system sensor histidine kinase VicK